MIFIQIAVVADPENGETLYAIGNDGNIYERTAVHYGPGNVYDGKSICRGHAYTSLFWRKLDLPLEEPMLEEKKLRLLEFQEEA